MPRVVRSRFLLLGACCLPVGLTYTSIDLVVSSGENNLSSSHNRLWGVRGGLFFPLGFLTKCIPKFKFTFFWLELGFPNWKWERSPTIVFGSFHVREHRHQGGVFPLQAKARVFPSQAIGSSPGHLKKISAADNSGLGKSPRRPKFHQPKGAIKSPRRPQALHRGALFFSSQFSYRDFSINHRAENEEPKHPPYRKQHQALLFQWHSGSHCGYCRSQCRVCGCHLCLGLVLLGHRPGRRSSVRRYSIGPNHHFRHWLDVQGRPLRRSERPKNGHSQFDH